jgi:uncharacterized glyoxalase superfamily protein PhnB
MNELTNGSSFTPEGWRTITPRIVARDARQLVEFIKRVFDATGEYRTDMPAVLTIGDSAIMISDAGVREPMAAFLYVYVSDADEIYQRAMQAGARSLENQPHHGDRRAMVKIGGNTYGKSQPILARMTRPERAY